MPVLPQNGKKKIPLFFQKERHFSGYSLDLRIFHVTDRDYFRRYYVFNREAAEYDDSDQDDKPNVVIESVS